MLEKTVGSDLRQAASPPWHAQLLNDQRFVALLFLLPTILVLCFVVIYPFISAISISFQDKMIGGAASYIGLGNYYELFNDRVFLKVIRNTIVYTLVGVALKFVLGLAMALVLAQDRPFNFLYRTLLFIPLDAPRPGAGDAGAAPLPSSAPGRPARV